MDDLPPTVPLDTPLLELGGTTLACIEEQVITSIQPYPSQIQAAADALQAAHGLSWPNPGQSLSNVSLRIVWSGKDQALLIGGNADPDLARFSALTDQSDASCGLSLEGPAAEATLARLCPVDLRMVSFPVESSARSLLLHCPLLLVRTGETRFEIYTFRSMARTAWHELETALRHVTARQALADLDAAVGRP